MTWAVIGSKNRSQCWESLETLTRTALTETIAKISWSDADQIGENWTCELLQRILIMTLIKEHKVILSLYPWHQLKRCVSKIGAPIHLILDHYSSNNIPDPCTYLAGIERSETNVHYQLEIYNWSVKGFPQCPIYLMITHIDKIKSSNLECSDVEENNSVKKDKK